MTVPLALNMTGISKSFPGVLALDNANLSVLPGEVHGLVGENGAGKSTIIKVLAGVYRRDAGEVEVGGVALPEVSPRTVHERGVRFIHQELHLVPHLTVAESVFMGQERAGWLGLDRRGMTKAAEKFLSESLGADLSGRTLVKDLSPAERKLVQVARALIDGQASLVVFDEPTAPLAADEVERVFEAIAALKSRGNAILYVSHYLAEIAALCDRVTVFRNGRDEGVVDRPSEKSDEEIIRLMIGRSIDQMFPSSQRAPGEPRLAVRGLTDGQRLAPVDLDVRAGEIVGIAGLLGSGREELIDLLFGLERKRGGTTAVDGEAARLSSPHRALARGMALVPRDRRHDGLVLDMTVTDNVNLATMEKVSSFGLVNTRRALEACTRMIKTMDIRPPDPEKRTRLLSGGNQQKVVLARWLAADTKVFVLDEPTVGVDVGAKSEIYRLLNQLADSGAAVLVSSNDSAELLGVCDRVVVLVRGEVVADLPTADLTLDELIAITTGTRQVAAPTGETAGDNA
ncbi:MAG: sugar ABC transporter ATP-binding protein [Propionicimonas sp.]